MKRGPNPKTIADGYSLSDERKAVIGPDVDFNYDGDKNNETSDADPHLLNPDEPKLMQSHEGEHRSDFGGTARPNIKISSRVYLWAICAALNSCNLGYDIGVNTVAGPRLQRDMNLSDLELEMFYGSINLFAMVGSLTTYFTTERFGRLKSFSIAAVLFILGVIIQSSASSYSVLMIGRVFVGLGVGYGLALDPLYIAEIAPASARGELVTWAEIALNVGITLGFSSSLVFGALDDDQSWRYMFATGCILPVLVIFLASCAMAESPRWLISKGEEEEGARVLQKIYGDDYDVDPIVMDVKESLEREKLAWKNTGWDALLFPSPAFRRMLFVGVGIAVSQQVVGIEAIQYYLEKILETAGLDSRDPKTAGILIGLAVVKLIFIIVGGKLFDRRGRRPVLFVSLCGVTAALLMLSINFFGNSSSSGIAIFALALYLAFFSLGMGPGAWLIPSEIFSLSVRAKAISLATFSNRLMSTIMASTFLSVASAITWAGFFFLLAVASLVVLAFVYYFLPETKGHSLEDMSVYFAEITGDRSLLDAEARIVREREAAIHAQATAPRFEPIKARDIPREQLPDATVSGTMA